MMPEQRVRVMSGLLPYAVVRPYSNQCSVASALVLRTSPLSLAELSWIWVACRHTPTRIHRAATMPRAIVAILDMCMAREYVRWDRGHRCCGRECVGACCPCPCSRSSRPRSGRSRRCACTCVPPSACLSRPTMSTTRISVTDSGIRLTLVRMRSASSSGGVAREERSISIGRSAAISGVHELLDACREAFGQRVELEVHARFERLHVAAGHGLAPLVPDDAAQHVHRRVRAHELMAALPVDAPVHRRRRRPAPRRRACARRRRLPCARR